MNEQTGRAGVYLAALAAERLGLMFREQPIWDQGIDAHLELTELASGAKQHRGTGRLIAAQIKAGPSWFSEPSPSGWWFRFSKIHANLWLNHSLPVIVMLVDPTDEVVYWQEISPRTVQTAGTGFKIEVPKAQTMAEAAVDLEALASGAAKLASATYPQSLERLPPGVVKLFVGLSESELHDAALLAYYLAEGRHNAAGVAASLLATAPVWVTRNGEWAWRALGNYAASHELGDFATDALTRAGEASGANAGRCYVAAALNALERDRARAQHLVDLAEAHGAAPFLTAALRAAIRHPEGDASPIALPMELQHETTELRSCGITQSYLYIQAKRRGDVAGALHHSQLMLAATSDDTAAMAGRADAILWVAAVGHVEPSLMRDAIRLLHDALIQRRAWGGPTVELAVALARAYLLQGDVSSVLSVCLTAPNGSATPADAGSSELRRLGIHAAILARRRDLVESLVESIYDSSEGRLARYRVGALDLVDDELRALLFEEFQGARDRGDVLLLTQTALHLAELGSDVLAELVPYVERSIIPASSYHLGMNMLAVSNDLDAGLPGLRELAQGDKQAAEILVRLLRRHGRYLDAVHACDAQLRRAPDALFVIMRAMSLVDLDDDRAETAALDAVAGVGGFPIERGRLLTYAAGKAADRGDWVTVEQRLSEVLEILDPPDDGSVWRLVTAELHLGHLERAAQLLDLYRPSVRSDEEGRLWLQAAAGGPWDASRASEALTLASTVADPQLSVALLGQVILSTHGLTNSTSDDPSAGGSSERRLLAQQGVPAELHRQAFQVLESLVERHGDRSGVKILRGEPEDLIDQLSTLLTQGAEQDGILTELLVQVRQSRLPMGCVATLSGHGYATLLVQRAFGPLVAASPSNDEYEREFDAAVESLNGAVVVDASSMLTASGLTGVYLVGHFARLTIPAAAMRDIHRASSDVRSSAGSLGRARWDTSAGGIRFTELSTEEFLRQLHRVEALQRVASTLPVGTPIHQDGLLDLPWPAEESAAWVDAILLAKDQDCGLWSDDLGLRRLAISLGVPAFGTAAVLDALRLEDVSRQAKEELEAVLTTFAGLTRRLASDLLVDLPLEPFDIVRIAETDEWLPLGGAVAISRPAWWVWQLELEGGVGPLPQLIELFGSLEINLPESLPEWQRAAMHGVAQALQPNDAARGLCELALLAWGPGGEDSDILEGIARAREVARQFGLRDPANEVPAAVAHLAAQGLLAQPEELANRILTEMRGERSQL